MNKKKINAVIIKKHEDFLKSIKSDIVRKTIDKHSIITGGSIVSMLLNERVKDFDYYFDSLEAAKVVAEYFVKEFNESHKDKTYLTTTKLSEPTVEVKEDRVKIIVPSAGIASESEENPYQYFEQQPDEVGENFVNEATNILDEADNTDSKPMEEIEKESYRVVFMSANAITLSDKIQLVIRFHGAAEEIHKNYDFTHCTNYWLASERKLYLNQAALECIITKQLFYQGSLYPVCSVIRTRKFLKQGWHINAGQYLKMCFQISELNLQDINVLEEQLTGVDAAYFFQVIEYCKKRQQEDKEFTITMPYLISIIDKIFN